jgi:hypothetical protein
VDMVSLARTVLRSSSLWREPSSFPRASGKAATYIGASWYYSKKVVTAPPGAHSDTPEVWMAALAVTPESAIRRTYARRIRPARSV